MNHSIAIKRERMSKLYILILLMVVSRSVLGDECSKTALSFFEILKLPTGGFLIDPETQANSTNPFHCSVSYSNYCKIMYMRYFLPPSSAYLETLKQRYASGCDNALSSMIETWLKTYSNVKRQPGLPYESYFDKVSVGKYLRANALIQYFEFHGLSSDTMTDFDYEAGLSWPWVDTVEECHRPGLEGWNCAFADFSSTTSTHVLLNTLSNPPNIDTTMEEVFSLRRADLQHVIQVLFFGKVLSMISEPSTLMQKYTVDNVVSLNDDIWTSRYLDASGRDTDSGRIKKFDSYEEFYRTVNSNEPSERSSTMYTSVSMHVRHGDSCDQVFDGDLEDIMLHQHPFSDPKVRPCFSIDIYMKKLHHLRKHYNVRRVFLSTDDTKMLERARMEPSFNWVFMDNSREVFGIEKGWVEYHHDSDNAQILFSSVADLNLMRYGDLFLGAFSSHFSKIAYYLTLGHKLRLAPFISLDHPLTCTTMQRCDHEWLSRDDVDLQFVIENMN